MKPELSDVCRKLIWWKSPSDVNEHELLAKIMEKGTVEMITVAWIDLGEKAFKDTLLRAHFGEFSQLSWSYWHHRLGVSDIPSLPEHPAFSE